MLATAVAQAAKPTPHHLSISAHPAKVLYGRSVALTGRLTGTNSAGKVVTLQRDAFPFDTLKNDGTTHTNALGYYAFHRTPLVNTKFRAKAKSKAPATSATVLVLVAPKVTLHVSDRTPKKGHRVRFYGRVTPQHDGQFVKLQRRKRSGHWRTVAIVPLTDAGPAFSNYSVKRRIKRNGTFRVLKPKDADHTRGKSRKRRLRVH